MNKVKFYMGNDPYENNLGDVENILFCNNPISEENLTENSNLLNKNKITNEEGNIKIGDINSTINSTINLNNETNCFKILLNKVIYYLYLCLYIMSCPICLEDFKDKEATIKLLCNHRFHRVCIDRWKLYSITCPYCRTEMEYSYKVKTDFCKYNIINKIIKCNISIDIDEDRLVIKYRKNKKHIEFMMIKKLIEK